MPLRSMQNEGAELLEMRLRNGLMGILEEVRLLRRGDEPFSMHATQHVTEDFGYDLVMRDFVRVFEWRRAVVGEGYDGDAWWQEVRVALDVTARHLDAGLNNPGSRD